MFPGLRTGRPDVGRRRPGERMGRINNQPDLFFFNKCPDRLPVHPSCEDGCSFQIPEQSFPVFRRHAHITADPFSRCIFRQQTSLRRARENKDIRGFLIRLCASGFRGSPGRICGKRRRHPFPDAFSPDQRSVHARLPVPGAQTRRAFADIVHAGYFLHEFRSGGHLFHRPEFIRCISHERDVIFFSQADKRRLVFFQIDAGDHLHLPDADPALPQHIQEALFQKLRRDAFPAADPGCSLQRLQPEDDRTGEPFRVRPVQALSTKLSGYEHLISVRIRLLPCPAKDHFPGELSFRLRRQHIAERLFYI